MSIRAVSFVEGEFYHLYNRGNSKQKIFHDVEDHQRFMGLLYACNSTNSFSAFRLRKDQNLFDFERGKSLVAIGSYALMPNHFHILAAELIDGGISKFMQKLSTAYSMYYNKKYDRVGGLFEGKFKSEHAGEDRYLKYLFSYINLNPVKLIDREWKTNGIRDRKATLYHLKTYAYSSYFDLSGDKRLQNGIIDMLPFPKYFSQVSLFSKEIFEWLDYKTC